MKHLLLLLLLSQVILAQSQEFSTMFYLTNIDGQVDSVRVGYDPTAIEGIDSNFGELDISSMPMSDFEIRAAQIDIYKVNCSWSEIDSVKNIVLQQSKIDITPKNCLSYIPGSTLSGFMSSTNILIKTDAFPILLSWDDAVFENECVSRSMITDWPINTWWDIPCDKDLLIDEVNLFDQNEITIEKHTGIDLIDESGDTLIMLTIVLRDHLYNTIDEERKEEPISIYPNPSKGEVIIPEFFQVSKVRNTQGQPVRFEVVEDKVYFNSDGLLFIDLIGPNDYVKTLKHFNVVNQ